VCDGEVDRSCDQMRFCLGNGSLSSRVVLEPRWSSMAEILHRLPAPVAFLFLRTTRSTKITTLHRFHHSLGRQITSDLSRPIHFQSITNGSTVAYSTPVNYSHAHQHKWE